MKYVRETLYAWPLWLPVVLAIVLAKVAHVPLF